MIEAERDLGLKETKGSRHNPRVVEMFAESGHPWVKDDETAWCSAAMNSWMVRAGMVGTGSLAARSWLTWGKSLNKAVKPGAIAVFKRGNSTWQGHVGILTGGETKTHVEVLGGNQKDAVNTNWYQKSKLLDTRWPVTKGNSRTIKLASAQGIGAAAVATSQAADIKDNVTRMMEGLSFNPVYVLLGAVCVVGVLAAAWFFYDRNQKIKEYGV